jgi:hypothetical protein
MEEGRKTEEGRKQGGMQHSTTFVNGHGLPPSERIIKGLTESTL